MWDYITEKIDIQKDVYDQSMRKKEQKKLQYNKRVTTMYFSLIDFVLLKNCTPYLGKDIER